MEKYSFDAHKVHLEIVQWIRDWFEINGKDCNAVLGLSGGKDSTIIAALCAEALGKDRVIGVAMPQGEQGLNGADKIAESLGIRFKVCNIGEACYAVEMACGYGVHPKYAISKQAVQNIPPRVRMTTLYAVAQTENGRVAYCDNLSERYLGYFTTWGDGTGDFGPIANLTVTEVLAVGDDMGLPWEWVHKVPDDGLPHSTSDEEKLGFTYAELDKMLRGIALPEDEERYKKMLDRHIKNKFKTDRLNIPAYYGRGIYDNTKPIFY